MTDQLAAFWRRIPNPVRAGWITALITFGSTLLTILTSILPELSSAISSRNFAPFYNSLDLAAASAVSAVTALLAGIVNAVYRWLKPIEQSYRMETPGDGNDAGQASNGLIWTVVGILLIAALVVWLARAL